MKKIIISSIILATLGFDAYAAENLKVKLSGRMDFQAGAVNEKSAFRSTNPADPSSGDKLHNSAFVNDTKIDINVDGKINNDFKYGGFIRLNTDTSDSTTKEKTYGNKTMIYLQHDKIGRIEGGSIPSAPGYFEMDVSNFGVGSYGVDGFVASWVSDRTIQTSQAFNKGVLKNIINAPGTVFKGKVPESRGLEFITYGDLPSNYSGRYYSDASKINLYTKPISELTVGFTYIPDMDSAGTITNVAPKNSGALDDRGAIYPASFRNIFGAGFTYDKKINKDWTAKAVLVGEIGKAKLPGIRNLKAYEAGLQVHYKKFKFGGTYGSWGKSLTLKQKQPDTKQGSSYWSLGFAQQIEKFNYSITFLKSKKAGGIESLVQKINKDTGLNGTYLQQPDNTFSDPAYNKFQNLVLDIDYQLAQGFLPYVTFSRFEFKESKGAKDNGYVALIGSRLLF